MIYLLVAVIIIICTYWASFYIRQERELFPAHKLITREIMLDDHIEVHWFESGSFRCESWFVKASGNQFKAPLVIVAHGQKGLIENWLDRLHCLTELGVHILLVEFPGYGRSSGRCNEQSLKDVFCAAYDWAAQREDVDLAQIIGMGRSMGGGVISLLAEHRPLKALWLMSTFTSLAPFLNKRGIPTWLLNTQLNTQQRLKNLEMPVLILHGIEDDVIDPHHSKQLNQAAKLSTLWLEEGDHISCPHNWPEFLRRAFEWTADQGVWPNPKHKG